MLVSVSVFVTSRCSIETDKQIELVLAWKLPPTLPSSSSSDNGADSISSNIARTILQCIIRKFGYVGLEFTVTRVSPKRILPSGTLSQTLDFEI